MSESNLDLGWSSPNIPAAIGISIGAGLATAIGGAMAFVPGVWQRLPQTTVLAISLALSAGVMLYVSFIEIFSKSYDAIATVEGMSEGGAMGITTLCFFLGMGVTVLLELLVHVIFEIRSGALPSELPSEICACHMEMESTVHELPLASADGMKEKQKEAPPGTHSHGHARGSHSHAAPHSTWLEAAPPPTGGERCHPTPPPSPPALPQDPALGISHPPLGIPGPHGAVEASVTVEVRSPAARSPTAPVGGAPAPTSARAVATDTESARGVGEEEEGVSLSSAAEKKRLARMGMMTALAIAIHNFPEGLATFLVTVTDTQVRLTWNPGMASVGGNWAPIILLVGWVGG
jgi:zinc transporter ZupT